MRKNKIIICFISFVCAFLMIAAPTMTVDALSGNNSYRKDRIWDIATPYYYYYEFSGTSPMTASEVYSIVLPATYEEAESIARMWNSGKANQKMNVTTYEHPTCVYNVNYCKSKGIYAGSHVYDYFLFP